MKIQDLVELDCVKDILKAHGIIRYGNDSFKLLGTGDTFGVDGFKAAFGSTLALLGLTIDG